MKLAVIGSRNITEWTDMINIKLQELLTEDIDEIVSGGAAGADTCAAEFARKNGLRLTEFLPCYERYGKAAPIVRNKEIVEYADKIIAFWDGRSKGTLSVINYSKKLGKACDIILLE